MVKHHHHHHHRSTEEMAAELGLPDHIARPAMVAYRSVGIGCFGAVMRFIGMPLEKIALYMNSSQVSGQGQFGQAIRLTFQEGALAPYRVVGPASLTAWFLQYSVMGVAFQFFDQTLSQLMGVRPVYYGKELMEPPLPYQPDDESASQQLKFACKTLLSPILAASLESMVSNRAEVQRYFGPKRFVELESALRWNPLRRAAGPAYGANMMRNIIMCQTSFVLTPITYKFYFPQEHKSKSSLFWYGLGMNIFVGNVIAITQQALWGRSLDYLAQHGRLSYQAVISEGLARDGLAAFFTGPKWFSRVLMNAPAQGTLPWFYNEILPLGEHAALQLTNSMHVAVLAGAGKRPVSPEENIAVTHSIPTPPSALTLQTRRKTPLLQSRRSKLAYLPTAHPDFAEDDDDDDDTETNAGEKKQLNNKNSNKDGSILRHVALSSTSASKMTTSSQVP